ncbi:MAG: endonuclease/exonuclease/phosphatase family protein [Flavobacteriaceae bacterium]
MGKLIFFFMIGFGCSSAFSQKQYTVRTIAFYNVENLFDTANDTLTFDDDRTPEGKDRWTKERYNQKVGRIAKVLANIGRDVTGTSPDLIGLCEVENKQVVEDLISHAQLKQGNYGIIHFDSPDERGIDVALLYKNESFLPTAFASRRLLLVGFEDERNYTRDQLVVSGILDDDRVHIIVNHWPSRSGGEALSQPHRIAAARLNRRIIDSIQRMEVGAKIIGMGDLNDDPTDASLKMVLRTKGDRAGLVAEDLFNPMEKLFRKGIGSLAYRDKWNLFDQIFLTGNLILAERGQLRFWKAGVFKAPYLITTKGPHKGYPFRTYAGGNYTGGYSDHFPVYAYFLKEK